MTAHKKPSPKPRPHRERPKRSDPRVDVQKFEDEIKDLKDKVLRVMADLENTRRRAEKDVQDTRAYAITGFARELLGVSDNFQRALAALNDDLRSKEEFRPFIEGVDMTARELQNIFERHGIRKISPKGEPFDHNFHQAMFEVETGDARPGTVVEVIQDGYVINGRLLRPAMVGVAKAPAKDSPKDKDSEKKQD